MAKNRHFRVERFCTFFCDHVPYGSIEYSPVLQLRGVHRLVLLGYALQAGELPAQGERVHEPHLERLLRDHPEVAVAHAVEEQVYRRVRGQQDVRDDGQVVHPRRPRVHHRAGVERLERKLNVEKMMSLHSPEA